MIHRKQQIIIAATALSVLLSACGTVSNARKIDYRNTSTLPALEVPPDLSAVPEQSVPGQGPNAKTYSGYTTEQRANAPAASGVLPQFPGVQLARDGQTRYVVVKAEPAELWDKVRTFLTTTGLSIEKENAKAGLIETHWAENYAFVGSRESNTLTKWIKSYRSTEMRDKYHVRLERGVTPGTVEIYIAHRGMEELEPDQSGAARPGWKPRPSDPELEVEMLQRLVAHLGAEQGQNQVAQVTPAPAELSPSARLTRNGSGAPSLALEDSLERAWRRVGLSLDRVGFTVEDRDRSKGIYYVRYIDPDNQAKEKGFFSRLFTGEEPPAPNQFQVQVKPNENGSTVEVLDKEGSPETSKTGERILSLLYEQLK